MVKRKKQYYLLPMDYLRKLGRVPEVDSKDKAGAYYPNSMIKELSDAGGKEVIVDHTYFHKIRMARHYRIYFRVLLSGSAVYAWTIPRNWLVYR